MPPRSTRAGDGRASEIKGEGGAVSRGLWFPAGPGAELCARVATGGVGLGGAAWGLLVVSNHAHPDSGVAAVCRASALCLI